MDDKNNGKQTTKENMDELFSLVAKINDASDVEKLFLDLCTFTEVEQMATRLKCAKLLKSGLTYTQVMEEADISSATLARVSRCVSHGSGGYNSVIDKYDK